MSGVKISGSSSQMMNGIYQKSEETVADLPVYVKKDKFGELFIEYYIPGNFWLLTNQDGRGTGEGGARLPCDPPCPLELCTEMWEEQDDGCYRRRRDFTHELLGGTNGIHSF